ncbi:MAG: excinuclease ABC subunit UvrA [Firmicutes bacterium]|nr:excinuclease ABC subunit UvrA [Bacillota bacterium]
MEKNKIVLKGCRENNLKNVNLKIPRDKIVVFTGVSGSGKSSLAFDTIYAEGQRRYMESLSSYARQFLGQMEKPKVDSVEGLSPAIAIDQKTTNNNPRSTVGTVTEIYDYLRLLYARAGTVHCPKCGKEIAKQTVDQIAANIMNIREGSKIQILSPVVRNRKGEHVKLIEDTKKNGYVRVRIDGTYMEIGDDIKLEKNKKHNIDVVVDRLVIKEGISQRLSGSLENALALSGGLAVVDIMEGEERLYSTNFACPDCDISIGETEPALFSFNNPTGACPECTGLGYKIIVDEDIIIPDKDLSIEEGAINASGWNNIKDTTSSSYSVMKALSKEYDFSLSTPFKDLSDKAREAVLYGTGIKKIKVPYISGGVERYYSFSFEGVINSIMRRYRETDSDAAKEVYSDYMSSVPCPCCKGKRLRPEGLAVTVGDTNITDLTDLSIEKIIGFFEELKLGKMQEIIADPILREIKARLKFLKDVGLDYLTLSRTAGTLSGGESQRIRLATQIGSGLVGVVYILDEPSIGLHQRDNDKLLATLKRLKDIGNTLIVVEHDEDTMRNADYIVDVGPYAGEKGGEIVFAGTYKEILKSRRSLTGAFLSGKEKIALPKERRPIGEKKLIYRGCRQNNLKDVTMEIPLGVFVCVTGVSGSGKSSFVNEILYKSLVRDLNRAKVKPGKFQSVEGEEYLDKVINIDQSPIGRTPRSNPATYTGLFDLIRDLYAQTPEAKVRGFTKGRFSFNVKGGRCEACNGDGIIKIEMNFLPDVFVPCEVCEGKRYNKETLEATYKGKNISDILEMTVDEALAFFENQSRIKNKLQTLKRVGLGYIRLGQSSTTLSGGEAQRVKLATELSRTSTGKTLYVLDEPTTGLHSYDVRKLIEVLQSLADGGNTVVVIEHNLDVIKTADHIIDLGPEGGDGGGTVICTGTPEEVARNENSYTGRYLKKYLEE